MAMSQGSSIPSINDRVCEILEKQRDLMEKQSLLIEKMLEHQKGIERRLQSIEVYSLTTATKTSRHELRFCEVRGEGTDASRMLDSYCRAESALASNEQVKNAVKMIIEHNTSKSLQYAYLFSSKDLARSEAACAYFWLTAKKGECFEYSGASASYEHVGRVGQLMPSFRARCCRELERQVRQGELPKTCTIAEFLKVWPRMDQDLRLLQHLCLPLGTSFQPLEARAEDEALRVAALSTTLAPYENFEFGCYEDAYEMLSTETREFIENYPITSTSDVRMRVSKVISSWVGYMSEVAEKQQYIEHFEYNEQLHTNDEKENEEWNDEWFRVLEYNKKDSTFRRGHAEIFEKYERIAEIKRQRKKAARKVELPEYEDEDQEMAIDETEMPTSNNEAIMIEDSGMRVA